MYVHVVDDVSVSPVYMYVHVYTCMYMWFMMFSYLLYICAYVYTCISFCWYVLKPKPCRGKGFTNEGSTVRDERAEPESGGAIDEA